MTHRPNQYQRRQAKRREDRIIAVGTILTLILFYIGYLVLKAPVDAYEYQEVLASNGTRTLEQIQNELFNAYALYIIGGFFVALIVITLLIGFVTRKRHNTFEFGDESSEQAETERSRPRRNLYDVNPREFEEQVAALITKQTGYRAKVTGGTGDQGVDIKVYGANNQLVGVVQCKRYRPNKALPPSIVREMATVKQLHQVNIAYLATTAYFTEETRQLAKQLDVRLIDGRDLEHIVRKASTSIRKQSTASTAPRLAENVSAKQDDVNARFRPPQKRNTEDDYHRSINGMWDDD